MSYPKAPVCDRVDALLLSGATPKEIVAEARVYRMYVTNRAQRLRLKRRYVTDAEFSVILNRRECAKL